MSRSELDLKRKNAAKRKRFTRQFVVALFIAVVFVGFLSLPSSSIELVKHNHSCSHIECSYTVSVKNTDHFGHSGYIRMNAFIEIDRGEAVSREIVASERVEFKIDAGEEKIIEGKFAVKTKPRIVNFSTGQIDGSI